MTLPQKKAVQFYERVMIFFFLNGKRNRTHCFYSLESVTGHEKNQRLDSSHSPAENSGRWAESGIQNSAFLWALGKDCSTTEVLHFFFSDSKPPWGSIQYHPETFPGRELLSNCSVNFNILAGCQGERKYGIGYLYHHLRIYFVLQFFSSLCAHEVYICTLDPGLWISQIM